MFGAYGDGKHDDTVAIQTAVNSGFNITFNVATYLISSAINVGSNKKFRVLLVAHLLLSVIIVMDSI